MSEPILWIGDEQEGEFAGARTLFVGSPEITFEEIVETFNDYSNLEQIYFGAGCCTEINQDVVRKCLDNKILSGLRGLAIITMEIPLDKLKDFDDKLLGKTCVIVTIDNLYFSHLYKLDPLLTQIKIQNLAIHSNHILMLGRLSNFVETDIKTLEGKTYKGDEVLK